MTEMVGRVAALVLAAAFAWAAIAKGIRFHEWRRALGRYGLSSVLEVTASVAVPALEAVAAALLVVGSVRVGAAVSLALISSFSLAILRARSLQGDRLPCGCFGRASVRDYRELLLRNAVLAVLAAIVLVTGSGDVAAPKPGEWLPAALVVVGATAGGWTLWQAATALRRGGHR